MKKIRLGDLLLSENLVDEETLEKARAEQKKTGKKFGRVLIDMGAIKDDELLKLLSKQLDLPYVDLRYFDVDKSLVSELPETYARRYRSIILAKKGDDGYQIGFADPLDINAYDVVAKIIKKPIHPAVVSETHLLKVIDTVYRKTEEISGFAQELSGEMVDDVVTTVDDLFDESAESADQAPVVKFLNSLFKDAVQARASDIHIEPDDESLRIRLRIDGVLSETVLDNKQILNALVQRLKLKSHMDIAERRVPQDGRFNFALQGKKFDVRVSTMPTSNGEAIVMGLLDQTSKVKTLKELGVPEKMLSALQRIYTKPYGMLLVTGPTGSGKTTTLYTVLSSLNQPEKKIITVEDPVEYRMNRINQVQVNPTVDLTFARVLRTILRQDPDIIMVGEIRDSETARIALRAAITGHLVLASLHTNNAMSSAMRLIDMGAEGYMVAAAIKGIIGQRLVRQICDSCISDHEPNLTEKAWLQSLGVEVNQTFKEGKGCSICNYRGYTGRIGVYELLEMNPDMLNALRQNNASEFTQAAIKSPGYEPLPKQVIALVLKGATTISEAIRVVGEIDEEFLLNEDEQTGGEKSNNNPIENQ